MQALEELDYLAALDNDGNLSEIGIIMSEIPLEPQMAKALLASCEFDCVSEMLTVAAMLSGAFSFAAAAASVQFQHLVFRRTWLLEELQQTRKSLHVLNLRFLLVSPQRPVASWRRLLGRATRRPSATEGSVTLRATTSPWSTSTTPSNRASGNSVSHR